MLRHTLIHPQINAILGAAGHHSTVLIADGNYPASSKKGPNAQVISLNLSPGIVNCTQVLEAILSAVPVEAIHTMQYETTGPYALTADPPAWDQYRAAIKAARLKLSLEPIEKWKFYEEVADLTCRAEHALIVSASLTTARFTTRCVLICGHNLSE